MKSSINRRSFIKRGTVAAGSIYAAKYLGFPQILSARQPDDILDCAIIGCGGRGGTHIEQVLLQKQNFAALVDPDDKQIAAKMKILQGKGVDTSKIKTFSDYRQMFDKMGKHISAAFVAAPNHHHFGAAMTALEAGVNVYCEKPLTHDISEARRLREAAAKYSKVATQMGNQGHCGDGYRRLCEFIWGGVIGNVTETHSWTDRANGGVGPRPPSLPVPKGMHWESWIGPAPYRDFSSDLHPHEWHGWYDFGNGSLGNMGCHVLEGAFWACKAETAESVEMEYVRGGSDERYPLGSRIRFDIPARGNMAPMKAYWYEGLNPNAPGDKFGGNHAAIGAERNLPPLIAELQAKYPDEELDRGDSGSLYVGEKGIIFTKTYGADMHILPRDKMDEIKQPPVSLPRPNVNPFVDFMKTCRAGRTDTATPFEYGARLTEFVLLGNMAQHAGPHNLVKWDTAAMRVSNNAELNRWVHCEARKGWPV
jgi:predicted dehydrogenase